MTRHSGKKHDHETAENGNPKLETEGEKLVKPAWLKNLSHWNNCGASVYGSTGCLWGLSG